MRLPVITAPLPATEYQLLLLFFYTSSLLLNFASVTFYNFLSSHHTLSQSNLRMANVTFALANRSIWLTFPPPAVMFILLSSPRSSSLNPGRGNATCSVWFTDLRRSLRSTEFSTTPQTHESLALIYSTVGKHQLQRRVILEYNADGANKADGL